MAAGGGRTSNTAGRGVDDEGREALRTLSDRPLEDDSEDRLGFAAYADALAELLDHPDTDTPLTVAISAPWGAGKTSLARMVEHRLKRRPIQRGDPPHITCWFNAWMHDDAPHLGAAFAAEVAKTANSYRPWWRRLLFPLPSAMLSPEGQWRRRLTIAVACFVAAAVIGLLPSVGVVIREALEPKGNVADPLQELVGSKRAALLVFLFVAFALSQKIFAIAQSFVRYIDDPRSEAAKGSMQEVSAQLGQLIEQASYVRRQRLLFPRDPRRFVIFVDDLERCRPPRAVEVCEVASQLLSHRNVVTVLVADMSTIAASAEIKYAQLEQARAGGADSSAGVSSAGSYGRLYLQKIVQIQFNLPPSPTNRMPNLLREPPSRLPSRRSWVDLLRLLAMVLLPVLGALVLGGMLLSALRTSPVSGDESAAGLVKPDTLSAFIFLPIIGAAFGFRYLLTTIYEDYNSFRTRRVQRRIDREIRHVLAESDDARPAHDVLKVIDRLDLKPRYAALAQQRAQRMLADESAQRKQAESEIREYLPALPRSAKRLFNHLRVLLVVAEGRGMLGGQPELQAKHLGKWAVLLERWPELSSALTVEPTLIIDLEAATSVEQVAKRLGPAVPAAVASQDLFDFLQSPTKLAAVVERLVYFQPSGPSEREDLATAVSTEIDLRSVEPKGKL